MSRKTPRSSQPADLSRRQFLQAAGVTVLGGLAANAQDVDKRVLEAERKRVEAVNLVRPSVVAVFDRGGAGGGSGVLISDDGYALTNFHVTGKKTSMKCGLPDGVLYDAIIVGVDKIGDVALIRLLPPEDNPKFKFPFAKMGDSDKCNAGDWSFAMGNPFLLATDFTPTVTFGLISGVHRYQPPAGGGLLEYTDCIQIDTSINPGNSGGPLFNMAGELVGINGRGSFDKRSRINSGVGYAISINQIKNFMGHLRSGLDTDHATLGANAADDKDEEAGVRLLIQGILDDPPSDVFRRGVRSGDELVSFAGRFMENTNQFKNILGIFPKGWRVPLVYRQKNQRIETLVRLMGAKEKLTEFDDDGKPKKGGGKFEYDPPTGRAAKFHEAKAGYANYYFNRQNRDRMLIGYEKVGKFAGRTGEWSFDADIVTDTKKTDARFVLREEKKADGKPGDPVVTATFDGIEHKLEPEKPRQTARELSVPPGSGGLLMALHHFRQLLARGEAGFDKGYFHHGGVEPVYPPPSVGAMPVKDLNSLRTDCEVLLTELGDVVGKWYFQAPKDGKDEKYPLVGFEIAIERDADPCEIYCYDYKPLEGGGSFPHRLEVRWGNGRFASMTLKNIKIGKAE